MLQSFKRKLGGAGGASAGSPRESLAAAAGDSTPRSDVMLPRRERRRTMASRELWHPAVKELPLLKDTPAIQRETLFKQKLELCSVVFDFTDASVNKREKEMKRTTLLELSEFVASVPGGQQLLNERMMPHILSMVSANVFRALPPPAEDVELEEEEEPVLDPAWPHLQLVYGFFLLFIVSPEVNAKIAKRYVTQQMCHQMVELFDSEDPRERDCLKTLLHRIYGKFMTHRSFIRRTIRHAFYQFVYETRRHNGIGELLEILGSIINGFALPLKQEHKQFLTRALLPLHIPKCMALYQQQLTYCVTQYIQKDPEMAVPVVLGLVKVWPITSTIKQLIFLNELEEVMEQLRPAELERVADPLFSCISKCIGNSHFQIAERALLLWNNEQLTSTGCLSRQHAALVLPRVYGALRKVMGGHWNETVESLAETVLSMFKEDDPALYRSVEMNQTRRQTDKDAKLRERQARWEQVAQQAKANFPHLNLTDPAPPTLPGPSAAPAAATQSSAGSRAGAGAAAAAGAGSVPTRGVAEERSGSSAATPVPAANALRGALSPAAAGSVTPTAGGAMPTAGGAMPTAGSAMPTAGSASPLPAAGTATASSTTGSSSAAASKASAAPARPSSRRTPGSPSLANGTAASAAPASAAAAAGASGSRSSASSRGGSIGPVRGSASAGAGAGTPTATPGVARSSSRKGGSAIVAGSASSKGSL